MKSIALLTMIFLPATFISVRVGTRNSPTALSNSSNFTTGSLQHNLLQLWRRRKLAGVWQAVDLLGRYGSCHHRHCRPLVGLAGQQ